MAGRGLHAVTSKGLMTGAVLEPKEEAGGGTQARKLPPELLQQCMGIFSASVATLCKGWNARVLRRVPVQGLECARVRAMCVHGF